MCTCIADVAQEVPLASVVPPVAPDARALPPVNPAVAQQMAAQMAAPAPTYDATYPTAPPPPPARRHAAQAGASAREVKCKAGGIRGSLSPLCQLWLCYGAFGAV